VNSPEQVVIRDASPLPRNEAPGATPVAGPVARRSTPRWLRCAAFALVLLGLGGIGLVGGKYLPWKGDNPALRLAHVPVERVDFSSVLTAVGEVESSHNTVISCDLERLEFRSEGRSVQSGGASTVLWLIDEGTDVKKGDVLCRLDASDYEEVYRQQQIKNQQAEAILKQGRLNFEVAELAVRQFREGLLKQDVEAFEGGIALAESELERSTDRYRWTEAMLKKGYVALSQKAVADRSTRLARLNLLSSRWDLRNYRQFGQPKTVMELESEVEKRRFEVFANSQRVTRNVERLAYYKKMTELCTIRAPHDGYVVHALDPYRRSTAVLEAGSTVRQSQELFYLPDLGNMEVRAYFHESVAHRVRPGMIARAKIEGLQNRMLEGHVVSIAQLPTNTSWVSDEVKSFLGIVKLDSVPEGLLPGMTAEVEVDVDRALDVLAVPAEAVAVEDGRDVCYVAGADGLRRRNVTIGRSSRDLLEVTRGLAEGEQVVLNPSNIDGLPSLVVAEGPGASTSEVSATEAFAADPAPASVE